MEKYILKIKSGSTINLLKTSREIKWVGMRQGNNVVIIRDKYRSRHQLINKNPVSITKYPV